MNSVMLRRFVLVFCLGVGGLCLAGGALSSSFKQDVISPRYQSVLQRWEEICERARTKSPFSYRLKDYPDCDGLFAEMRKHITRDSKLPVETCFLSLLEVLSKEGDSPENLVAAFCNVTSELHNLSRTQQKFEESEIQNTLNVIEALLYVLVRKICDKSPTPLVEIPGSAELSDALCRAYESLELLEGKENTEGSRRAFGSMKLGSNEATGLAALAIVVSLGAYKIHTRKPKMVTINGVEYPYVTPRILRDRSVANLTSPTEITRERNKLLRKTIGYWSGLELYTKLAGERYNEICTAVCYQQPIVYYSADMKDVCSYATWQEVIKVIHQNLDILEKSMLIVPVAELRDFTKLIDWDSQPPYKNQIQDIYEFAPSLRTYYKRASREFWGLMDPEARPQKQSPKKLSLKYCKRVPSQGEQSNGFHLCVALHGLKRGPRYRTSYTDLIQGFQVSQNILETLFHVVVMRVYGATGRFYEHFPTFLAELYGRTMSCVYPR